VKSTTLPAETIFTQLTLESVNVDCSFLMLVSKQENLQKSTSPEKRMSSVELIFKLKEYYYE